LNYIQWIRIIFFLFSLLVLPRVSISLHQPKILCAVHLLVQKIYNCVTYERTLNMSQHSDSREHQMNGKKRTRTNHDTDDVDDGEIQESDELDHSAMSGKRLRRSTTVPESHKDNSNTIRNVAVTSESLAIKKSREEFERERQIRMAALRGGTETDETEAPNIGGKRPSKRPDVSASNATQNHSKNAKKSSNRKNVEPMEHADEGEGDGEEDEEELEENDNSKMMEELFGISNFGSTKNTKVITNHTSAAVGTTAKHLKPRKYRQYMNRKNGFNRPLDNV
jgi:U4/U6.U5 tri-snRNP-associated protein 3